MSSHCKSCRDGSRIGVYPNEAEGNLLKEAYDCLEYFTSKVFSNHYLLKEDVGKKLKENCKSQDKYILLNKIAYFSMKSIESRRSNVSVINSIEKKKIKMAEKSVQLNAKQSLLKRLLNEKNLLEESLHIKNTTRHCLENVNKSMLHPLLDYSRLRLAINAFLKFPILGSLPDRMPVRQMKQKNEQDYKEHISLSGISTILGVPLPNAGDYSGVPPHVTCTALGLICHLLSHLSRVLNIHLPHPLLPFHSGDCSTIKPYGDLTRHISLSPATQPALDTFLSSSSSLPSFFQDAIGSTSKVEQSRHHHMFTPSLPVTSHAAAVYCSTLFLPASFLQDACTDDGDLLWRQPLPFQEIDKAGSGTKSNILHERDHGQRHCSNTSGVLAFKDMNDDLHQANITQAQQENSGMYWSPNVEFASGLTLLQANVIHMCLALGVTPDSLWPPQALLLNLRVLNEFCLSKTEGGGKCTREDQMENEKDVNVDEIAAESSSGESDFQQLGKCLKAYCEVIQQAKQDEVHNNIPSRLGRTDQFQREFAEDRDKALKDVEAQLCCFDTSQNRNIKKSSRVSDVKGSTSPAKFKSCDHFEENSDDSDTVHISFDYEESSEDFFECPPDGPGFECTNENVYVDEEDEYKCRMSDDVSGEVINNVGFHFDMDYIT